MNVFTARSWSKRSKHRWTQEKVQAYTAVLHFYQINSCLLYRAVSVAEYSEHMFRYVY